VFHPGKIRFSKLCECTRRREWISDTSLKSPNKYPRLRPWENEAKFENHSFWYGQPVKLLLQWCHVVVSTTCLFSTLQRDWSTASVDKPCFVPHETMNWEDIEPPSITEDNIGYTIVTFRCHAVVHIPSYRLYIYIGPCWARWFSAAAAASD